MGGSFYIAWQNSKSSCVSGWAAMGFCVKPKATRYVGIGNSKLEENFPIKKKDPPLVAYALVFGSLKTCRA